VDLNPVGDKIWSNSWVTLREALRKLKHAQVRAISASFDWSISGRSQDICARHAQRNQIDHGIAIVVRKNFITLNESVPARN
jgi:hypothetical protein